MTKDGVSDECRNLICCNIRCRDESVDDQYGGRNESLHWHRPQDAARDFSKGAPPRMTNTGQRA